MIEKMNLLLLMLHWMMMRIGKEKRTLGMHADGMLLLEADRILHSGGFFVWTVDVSLQLQSLKEMERQLGRLCWKVVGRAGTVTVWQKPSNITDIECHLRRDIPVCLTTRHGSGSTVW